MVSLCCDFNNKVHLSDKITVAVDAAVYSAAVIGVTVKSLLNCFNCKVSVSAVDNFEESDLWITSKVNILGAVGDELH
jgi:hypothetical protein